MTIQSLPVRCAKCEHCFALDIPVQCSARIAVAAMKEARCPECGAGAKDVMLHTSQLRSWAETGGMTLAE